jgi:hypothetical protein
MRLPLDTSKIVQSLGAHKPLKSITPDHKVNETTGHNHYSHDHAHGHGCRNSTEANVHGEDHHIGA